MDHLDATITAIADPIRRSILQRLAHGPATAGQLGTLHSVSRPAVSRHLRVLREAGLVRATARGRHLWYEADAHQLLTVEQWLRDMTKRMADAPRLIAKEPM